ncbi:MAG: M23 family metallopeptidase [Sphingobacteriales bacterium]|nr:MAG: M23 family metallopeptidase [Sphingobacteriales bacterium]
MRFFKILLFALLIVQITQAQKVISGNKYPLTDFRQPLDIIPPALSGSFGEIRSNHFHSGTDFRTNQREGYPVYAVSDGYISRLRVQNSGFGLALYINHPNGFTTVYGHLQRFNQSIGEKVKALQYKLRSYEIDEFPDVALIPVRKGDLIAWTGNSGSSGGPHLHFEVRDTKTEATINPQLFGISIPDNIPPVISSLYVYRLNNKVFNEFTPKQYFQVIGTKGIYSLNKVSTINVQGEIGFGISTTDRHNGLSGLNGVYSITLEVDDVQIFNSTLERFQFDQTRAINSHIDFPGKQVLKTNIQKSFKDPGNPLPIYSGLVNNGRLTLHDDKVHAVRYTVTDVKGNKSVLIFNVRQVVGTGIKTPAPKEGILYSYNRQNEYKTDAVSIVFPFGTLYNDLNFIYKTTSKPIRNAFSEVHEIHNTLTPLHNGFDLWIKPDSTLGALKDKALIVNTSRISQGGYFEDGYIKAKPRVFGNYFVAVDTVPPTIVPVNIGPNKNMSQAGRISFRISDNLSGIKSFNGYIDGQWILMEFDAKTASLWHIFDNKISKGQHTFELIVEDMKANAKKYVVTFIR